MATPRKHWFRVADSILYEPWDDKTLATAVRFWAWLNTRWARLGLEPQEACRGFLERADALKITGTTRMDRARLALSQLSASTTASGGLALAYYRDSIAFSWPKYAELQGLATPKQTSKRPEIAPSAPAPARRNKKHTTCASTRTRKRAAIPFPVELSEEQRTRLVDWSNEKQIPLDFVKRKVEDLRLWAQSKDERKADWVAAIQGAVRRDWEKKQHEANQPHRGDDTIAGAVERIAARRGLRPGG